MAIQAGSASVSAPAGTGKDRQGSEVAALASSTKELLESFRVGSYNVCRSHHACRSRQQRRQAGSASVSA
jgi:hypothetical protein